MPPPFRHMTLAEFAALLDKFPFTRRIVEVHMHHTWRPTQAQYNGEATIVGMWRAHISPPNNWSDIAQHLTIAPDGTLWLGRNWNLPPASARGHNGTAAAGPFMFEMIGDFDVGQDRFRGKQKEAALQVVALVQDRFKLPLVSLRFHHQMSPKSCPGSSISYQTTLNEAQARRRVPGPAAELDGLELALAGGAVEAAARAREEAPALAEGADDARVAELLGALLSGSGLLSAAPAPFAAAELPEAEGSPPGMAPAAIGGEEAFLAPAITPDMKEALRPHVIDLKRGQLAPTGELPTTTEDVDAIFGEHLERAVENKTAQDPLRLVIWAHGGLVNEVSGLEMAYRHVGWWNANDVYPLFFVWQTGLLESLERLILGGGPREEAILDSVIAFADRQIENLARDLHGPAIWEDMKETARLAVDAQKGGGARYAAQQLAAFCRRHAGAVELHAVGHSAGAIFHAVFLPVAFELGVPPFKTLSFLAPAIRVDQFKTALAPLIGENEKVGRLGIFTMNKLRELADTCIHVYHKSLLYLIYYALEAQRETPLLGLEISLRGDADLKAMFGLGMPGAGSRAPIGDVVWSKTPDTAPPQSRSTSIHHGDFHEDGPTMESLLRRITNDDQIRVSFPAPAANREIALPGPAPALEAAGGVPEEVAGPALSDLADALERLAEEAPDPAEAAAEAGTALLELGAAPGEGAVGLEAAAAELGAVSIRFGPRARSATVSAFTLSVLRAIMRAAGLASVVISSTQRSPAEQARVMYNNLVRFGVAQQRRLYAAPGNRVIDTYVWAKNGGQTPAEIKAAMTQTILAVGPTHVSRHTADPRILNVIDIAPGSVSNRPAFERAIIAEPRVAHHFFPPADPGYHLEIPQPRTA